MKRFRIIIDVEAPNSWDTYRYRKELENVLMFMSPNHCVTGITVENRPEFLPAIEPKNEG